MLDILLSFSDLSQLHYCKSRGTKSLEYGTLLNIILYEWLTVIGKTYFVKETTYHGEETNY